MHAADLAAPPLLLLLLLVFVIRASRCSLHGVSATAPDLTIEPQRLGFSAAKLSILGSQVSTHPGLKIPPLPVLSYSFASPRANHPNAPFYSPFGWRAASHPNSE